MNFLTIYSELESILQASRDTIEFFLFFVALDILTGVLKSIAAWQMSSSILTRGIVKKIGMMVSILAVGLFAALVDLPPVLVSVTVVSFIIGELKSIRENLRDIGVEIPLLDSFEEQIYKWSQKLPNGKNGKNGDNNGGS